MKKMKKKMKAMRKAMRKGANTVSHNQVKWCSGHKRVAKSGSTAALCTITICMWNQS